MSLQREGFEERHEISRAAAWFHDQMCQGVSALGWPGSDLLSRVLRRSIIGAEEFNGRVRNGIGCLSPRNCHQTSEAQSRRRHQPEMRPHSPCGGFRAEALLVFISAAARARRMRMIKSNELLVPVSFTRCRASTRLLSTGWSIPALGECLF